MMYRVLAVRGVDVATREYVDRTYSKFIQANRVKNHYQAQGYEALVLPAVDTAAFARAQARE